jgi:hypothetical protein
MAQRQIIGRRKGMVGAMGAAPVGPRRAGRPPGAGALVLPGAGPMAGGFGWLRGWCLASLGSPYGECVAVSRGRESFAGDQRKAVRLVLGLPPLCRVVGAAFSVRIELCSRWLRLSGPMGQPLGWALFQVPGMVWCEGPQSRRGSLHLIVRPAPEVDGLLNGVASTTSEARCVALTPMGVAAIEAVTIAADRTLTLTDSGGLNS